MDRNLDNHVCRAEKRRAPIKTREATYDLGTDEAAYRKGRLSRQATVELRLIKGRQKISIRIPCRILTWNLDSWNQAMLWLYF